MSVLHVFASVSYVVGAVINLALFPFAYTASGHNRLYFLFAPYALFTSWIDRYAHVLFVAHALVVLSGKSVAEAQDYLAKYKTTISKETIAFLLNHVNEQSIKKG
jgi:hypothetical protein